MHLPRCIPGRPNVPRPRPPTLPTRTHTHTSEAMGPQRAPCSDRTRDAPRRAQSLTCTPVPAVAAQTCTVQRPGAPVFWGEERHCKIGAAPGPVVATASHRQAGRSRLPRRARANAEHSNQRMRQGNSPRRRAARDSQAQLAHMQPLTAHAEPVPPAARSARPPAAAAAACAVRRGGAGAQASVAAESAPLEGAGASPAKKAWRSAARAVMRSAGSYRSSAASRSSRSGSSGCAQNPRSASELLQHVARHAPTRKKHAVSMIGDASEL